MSSERRSRFAMDQKLTHSRLAARCTTMLHTPSATGAQEQTRAALEAMRAYFIATDQARPRQERQRLASEWLAAVRRLRTTAR
jgi:hypothetical protein